MFKENTDNFRNPDKTGTFRRKRLITALGLISILSTCGFQLQTRAADFKLAAFFADHMVLQRDRKICIWGTGDAGASVNVNIASLHATAIVGTNHEWQAYLAPMPAGGPYSLSVTSGDRTVNVNDVLYGDIWLCSGQSNMQMPVKECDFTEQQAMLASQPQLRLCTVGKSWNAKPQTSADIKWRTGTPDSGRNFSAVGYFFAGELLRDPALAGVPLGIIDSSFGGTTCEGWIPHASLANFDPGDLHDSMFGIKPAMLYNAMIAPLGNSPIKGVIWYQGESNSGHPDTYPRLLSTMINAWRQQFNTPHLPFFIVQLPDYAYQCDDFYWPWLREAQAKVIQATPDTSLVIGINTTDGFNLHPKQKLDLARRVALLVRRHVYGENIVASGPVFKSAIVEGRTMRVTFETGGAGLSNSSPGSVRGFMIAGRNGSYRFADARINGDDVLLQCDQVPAPETVRYAWAGVPDSSLVNQSGLPAAPFRTDTFPASNVELQKEPVSHHLTTPTYEITIDGSGKVTSLIVHGAQFISNEPGADGGTSIPGLFGPRALADVQSSGPDRLSCGDNDVTLLLKFQEDSMQWMLTNRSQDDIHFSLALAYPVIVTQTGNTESITLTRKKSSLTVHGFNSVSDSENGKALQVTVKGEASRQFEFNLGGK